MAGRVFDQNSSPVADLVDFVRLKFCVLAIVAGVSPGVRAHEAFADYVWHRVELSMNAQHVDVTVELTFFETWSTRERQRMDANQDGEVQRAESEGYAKRIAATVDKELALFVADRRVALFPLYAPEVNLLGRNTVEGGHHQLTLRYFAPLPAELSGKSELIIEDRLWPEARCLAECAIAANATGVLEAGRVAERALPAGLNAPLRFTARYIKPVKAGLDSSIAP
jgi:hypothetical protein